MFIAPLASARISVNCVGLSEVLQSHLTDIHPWYSHPGQIQGNIGVLHQTGVKSSSSESTAWSSQILLGNECIEREIVFPFSSLYTLGIGSVFLGKCSKRFKWSM